MKKSFGYFMILSCLCTQLHSKEELEISKEKIKELKKIYSIGKNIKASDGMTFGYSLVAIYGVESSFGKILIGDTHYKNGKEKFITKKSLSGFQIKVSTALETLDKNKFLQKKYNNIYTHPSNKEVIAHKLLTDYKFSAYIAGYFLRDIYERALKMKKSNPLRKSIGKYNGGWGNKKYFPKVAKMMGKIKKIIPN